MPLGRDVLKRCLVLFLVLTLSGAACGRKSATPEPGASAAPVTITIWRVFDEPEYFTTAIEKYRTTHPNVQIQVEQKDFATYEQATANAIAAGNPPDIWIIRNDWLPRHVDKLQPMPDGLLAAASTNKDDQQATANLDFVKNKYPEVVQSDAALSGKLFGIPLSIDSLSLYFNQDQLREAGIATSPATWSDFITDVQKLTKYDANDRTVITHAGAAIGTAKNVNRSSDIVSLLMLQNHTPMVSGDNKSAIINGAIPKEGGGLAFPGTSALEFYTGFADPKKTAYTWNNNLANSIDAFAEGKVSMIFSYNYLKSTLLQKNPNLNYGVGPVPQVENTGAAIDYPTYWLEAVTRNAPHATEAWDFIKFMAKEGGDTLYQQASGKPAAAKPATILSIPERVTQTDATAPWSFQNGTVVTWFRGTNPAKVEQIFNEMIENVVSFGQGSQVAIDNAAAQITKTFQEGQTQ